MEKTKIKKVYLEREITKIVKKLERMFPGAYVDYGMFLSPLLESINFEVFFTKSVLTETMRNAFKAYLPVEDLENDEITDILVYQTHIKFAYDEVGACLLCSRAIFENKIVYNSNDEKLIISEKTSEVTVKKGYILIGFDGEKMLGKFYPKYKHDQHGQNQHDQLDQHEEKGE